MSDSRNAGEGGFGNLPKWPAAAKELPESRPTEPPRSRLKWSLGLGVVGGLLGLFRSGGSDPAYLAGSVTGGFMVFALIGLIVEHALYDRERRRRWEDR
ncbi:unnamed protein product [Gemmata massiliana]|uniref:Uncharacterized protein n=1 Tax=Gemmata massiliana TaxID=1210884 RepID=A0A6P2D3R7_9BACT|nr:hypothetical protein [Gemmata massiliana]VTR94040.1 unnamed protein product [Gemmata massiliana]